MLVGAATKDKWFRVFCVPNSIMPILTREELADLLQTASVTKDGLNVMALTFNCNAKLEDSLDTLLGEMLCSNAGVLPDVLVVGLQEVIPLTPQNIIGANLFTESEEVVDRWMWLIAQGLSRIDGLYDDGKVNAFEVLCKEQMVGLWVCVFVSSTLRPQVKNVQKATCPRGVGGMFGNKGAVCVRMDILDSSICIVNAHFAAHRGRVEQRNQDHHAILHKKMFHGLFELRDGPSATPDMVALQQSIKKIRSGLEMLDESMLDFESRDSAASFSSEGGVGGGSGDDGVRQSDTDYSSSSSSSSSSFSSAENSRMSPHDHDIILWLGDLNYRIHSSVPDAQVFEMISSAQISELAEFDQLNIEKDRGSVFTGFHEGILHFPPTYKFVRGTDMYDQRSDKKVRCPSWCDRVLWRTAASLKQDSAVSPSPETPDTTSTNSTTSSAVGFPMPFENVELMTYSRGSSTVSDHKPVYASLNVKVKRVDWASCEQTLLDVMEELCHYDGDLREALLRSGGSPLTIEPASINLHSIPPVGDNVQLNLTNCLDCDLGYSIDPETVPAWLRLDPLSSVLSPGASITLRASTDHVDASASYGNLVSELDRALSTSKHLLDASSRPEISALLRVQLKALRVVKAKADDDAAATATSSWAVLETNYSDAGHVSDILLPAVCFLGSL